MSGLLGALLLGEEALVYHSDSADIQSLYSQIIKIVTLHSLRTPIITLDSTKQSSSTATIDLNSFIRG